MDDEKLKQKREVKEIAIKNLRIKDFKDKMEKFEENKKVSFVDVIKIERENIKCIKISYQFFKIYAGLSNCNINLYSLDDGELIITFVGHEMSVTSIDLNTNDSLMFSGSADNTLRVWKTYNGECIHTISLHTAAITKILLNMKHDLLLSSSWDKTIKLYEIEK